MKVCKHCKEVNTNDTLYCCNCGQSNFIISEEVPCPLCGAINDKSFTHCINCGNSLAEQAKVEVHDEAYAPAPVNIKEELSGVFDTGLTSIPSEMARCPHCGALVPITAIFCQKCGVSVASLHSRRLVQRKVCPHCGRHNKLDASYCSYCFSSLANAETEELQVVHESQNLGDVTIRQAYLEGLSGKNLICSNCGTLNSPTEPFCVNCGLKLEADAPKKYCPNCGAENAIDASFCFKCRWAFEGDTPDSIEKWTCEHCEHVNNQEDTFCPHCGQKRNK